MATRTFIVVPPGGGKIREIHISLWIFLPVFIFLAVGGTGLYWMMENRSPDREQKQKTKSLQSENRLLKNRYRHLQSDFEMLKDRIKDLKIQELEIQRISGLLQNSGSGKKTSNLLTLFTTPFHTKHTVSLEKLIADAESTDIYYENLLDKIALQPQNFAGIPSVWPCGDQYTFISFGFGARRDPFTGKTLPHLGIDIPAPQNTPVYASANGLIVRVENHRSFGKKITIEHDKDYVTVYAHLSQCLVREGQRIRKGQTIGYVGNTGYSIGFHLHYEVLRKEIHQNPETFLFPLSENFNNIGT
jgi:murein DD-endopeptidase MepM/ murein hydrolase activator NlpD